MKGTFGITAILVIFLLLNCEEDKQCTEKIEISVNIDFKTLSSGISKDTIINNLTVIGKDTPYYNTNNLKSISLTLSQSSDTSEYRFSADTIADTILFCSSREHFLVSFECGFATRFILENIISQDILTDSVSIINPNVDRSDETNVIFFY